MRGWLSWFGEVIRRRRRPILITLGVIVAYTGLVIWQNRPEPRPPRTIDDPTFEAAAATLCAERIPPLRAVRREGNTDDNLEEETAAEIDRVANELAEVVEDMRTLPVRQADRAEITEWLGHFDDFVDAGRRYADALRTGDPDVYNEVDDDGVAPLKAISRFARANHLDACIP